MAVGVVVSAEMATNRRRVIDFLLVRSDEPPVRVCVSVSQTSRAALPAARVGGTRVLFAWLLFSIVASFAACGATDTARWREEVELVNGKMIVLERSATALSSGLPVSRRGPTTERRIVFPDLRITWTGDGSVVPLAVEVRDATPYIVINLRRREVCEQYGDPESSVIYLRWESNSWNRIPREAFPRGGKANLLINPWGSNGRNDVSGFIRSKDKHLAAPYNFDVNKPLEKVIALPTIDVCPTIPRVPRS
jgi:hypothetical protein